METSTAWSGHAYSVRPLTIDGGLAWLRSEMEASGSGALTGQELWTATLAGRSLLVQHEPVNATMPANAHAATVRANALVDHAGKLIAALAKR